MPKNRGYGGMVDAADLKSVEPYKLVGVQVSLPPFSSRTSVLRLRNSRLGLALFQQIAFKFFKDY